MRSGSHPSGDMSDLSDRDFKLICSIVRERSGIWLHEGKRSLVRARLAKRLRKLGFRSFSDYIKYVRSDPTGREVTEMVDAISTNVTSFFREVKHFQFMKEVVAPEWASAPGKTRRIWSAACSSGEEPYSIAIALLEAFKGKIPFPVRILATDIAYSALEKAARGVYPEEALRDVHPSIRSRYFVATETPETDQRAFKVSDNVMSMVTLKHLNLVGPWPMKHPFDLIFCRNVLIYFDRRTKCRLIERFHESLSAGGYLFLGNAEGLGGGQKLFKFVRATIYRKA